MRAGHEHNILYSACAPPNVQVMVNCDHTRMLIVIIWGKKQIEQRNYVAKCFISKQLNKCLK